MRCLVSCTNRKRAARGGHPPCSLVARDASPRRSGGSPPQSALGPHRPQLPPQSVPDVPESQPSRMCCQSLLCQVLVELSLRQVRAPPANTRVQQPRVHHTHPQQGEVDMHRPVVCDKLVFKS